MVAPLVGAWIEIICITYFILERRTSLLSWERGLKFKLFNVLEIWKTSLLSWERGLKLYSLRLLQVFIRRSSRGSVD